VFARLFASWSSLLTDDEVTVRMPSLNDDAGVANVITEEVMNARLLQRRFEGRGRGVDDGQRGATVVVVDRRRAKHSSLILGRTLDGGWQRNEPVQAPVR
jgi:hypothetical protein